MDEFGGNPEKFDLKSIDWKKLRKRLDNDPESFSMNEILEIISFYDSSIRAVDEAIGRLFREPEKQNRTKNLLVIIVADHGEEFREHGRFGHVRTLFDSLLKIPLLFLYPEEWTASWLKYLDHREDLVDTIKNHMNNWEESQSSITELVNFLSDNYFSARRIYKTISMNRETE